MKYYAVKKGKKPGIYQTWDECKKQTNGFSGAKYKSFNSLSDAEDYLNINHAQEQSINENTHKQLTRDQQVAYDAMLSGENVFVTGEAGTGKSFVVNRFIDEMKKKQKNILVCAPTGIAAIHIGGATIHRCFQASLEPQINVRIHTAPVCVQEADIIIIDEISMCRVDLFDYVVRVIAKAEEISLKRKQLIVIGDFFQLPPVTTPNDRKVLEKAYPGYRKGFAFESENWKDFHFQVVALKNVKRQNDMNFIKALNQVRIGNPSSIEYFNANASHKLIDKGIILCARNDVAKKINEEKLNELPSRAIVYKAIISGDVKASDKPTEDELRLKMNARVIVLINDHEGKRYQNGSLGEIVELNKKGVCVRIDQTQEVISFSYHEWVVENYDVVKESINGIDYNRVEKQKVGSFQQIPLKLAYAITIHKSQGQTYDKVNLIPYSFDCGQLYVALSRVKSIKGLSLLQRMTKEYLICDEKVKKFYQVDYVDKDALMKKLGEMVFEQGIQNFYPEAINQEIMKIKKLLD